MSLGYAQSNAKYKMKKDASEVIVRQFVLNRRLKQQQVYHSITYVMINIIHTYFYIYVNIYELYFTDYKTIRVAEG